MLRNAGHGGCSACGKLACCNDPAGKTPSEGRRRDEMAVRRWFQGRGNTQLRTQSSWCRPLGETKSSHLRIFQDGADGPRPSDTDAPQAVSALCRTFYEATGWPLRYVPVSQAGEYPDPLWSAPVDPGVGDTPGYLMIGAAQEEETEPPSRNVNFQAATALANSSADVLGELLRYRAALARREAELAASIPVVGHPDEPAHLAERLLAVLRGGAQGIGCHAAGLYLLDDTTSQLKLRSCWGLPAQRLVDPARPLRGAVADLEALTGHAVVLTQPAMMEYWCVPESCAAAVCVPISTATTLLGTLWMFADEPRDFNDRETNLVEIVAGRLAGELEREILLSEGMASADLRRQFDTGQRLQQGQLPRIPPLVDPWDVAGSTRPSRGPDGAFYDWFTPDDGSLGISVGDAQPHGIEAALVGQSVRSAIRAHAAHETDPGRILSYASRDLWSGSAGDQYSAALYAVMAPDSGTVRLAMAGNIVALVLRGDDWEPLATGQIPLGVQGEETYSTRELTLQPGQALVIATGGIRTEIDSRGRSLDEQTLADALRAQGVTTATGLVGAIGELAGLDSAFTGNDSWATVAVMQRPSAD
jgi:sigma-B regulation protein RsbU (phosphoserine phosphatase)